MNALEIIIRMCGDGALAESTNVYHYEHDDKGNNNWLQLDHFFGPTKQICGKLEEVDYLYQYSDVKPVLSELPDVVIVLEDGRCVLLFKIE